MGSTWRCSRAAYGDIREAEGALDLEHLDPVAALRAAGRVYVGVLSEESGFSGAGQSRESGEGAHFRKSERLVEIHGVFRRRLAEIFETWECGSVFRKGIDADQLNLTMAAIGYYYLTNRYTNSIIFGLDLGTSAALDARLAFNLETVLRLVLKSPE
jgi:hypothetical protein